MSRRVIGENASEAVKAKETEKKRLEGKQLREVYKTPGELAASWKPIPTGFAKLDCALNGGLVPQLYILGAESSTGKSTFLLNVAENIARGKKPVMYFSLEMPREHVARLMICHCLIKLGDGKLDPGLVLRNFTNQSELDKLKTQNPGFQPAFDDYRELGKHFYVFERGKQNPDYNAEDIYKEVEAFTRQDGEPMPIVIVDYLQILDGKKDKYSFDQRAVVDYNVGVLTQITSELKVPVIAISSLNRAANKADRDIEMSDFKESGRIEYSADVLLALKYKGSSQTEDGFQRRALKLSILKNRYGEKDIGESSGRWLWFYPQFGLFKTAGKLSEAELAETETQALNEITKDTKIRKETDTDNDSGDKDDTEYKRLLNSRISVYLHQTPENYGFKGRLNIGRRKYFIACLLRKKDDKDVGGDSLNLWDLAVMDAVYAVTDRGEKRGFTITELIKLMCGKSRLSNRSNGITEKFRDALDRLNNREMIIDITDDIEMRFGKGAKEEPSASDRRRLAEWIEARRVTDEDELNALSEKFGETAGRTLVKGTVLSFEKSGNSYTLTEGDMPILFEYTRNLCHENIKYDPKLWEHFDGKSRKNFTRQKLLIRYFLIREIAIAKHNRKDSRRVNIENLLALLVLADSDRLEMLKDGNIENLKGYANYSRWLGSVRDDACLILDDLKKHGYISGKKLIDKKTLHCEMKDNSA